MLVNGDATHGAEEPAIEAVVAANAEPKKMLWALSAHEINSATTPSQTDELGTIVIGMR